MPSLLLGVASLVRRPLRVTVSTIATVAISGSALGVAIWQWTDVEDHGAHTYVANAVVMDGFSVLVMMLVSIAMLLSALVADGYLRREGVQGAEFHVLAMVSASGAMMMAMANDLIVIFLGLEILSIALYVLTAFNYRRAASGEAALKYFILGGFSSAIFVYGIALDLRGDRIDQPDPDLRLPLQERPALQRAAPGRAVARARRLRLQGGGGAVPHVDARRVPGCAVPGDRVHGGGGQGGRLRRHAPGPLLVLRRGRRPTGGPSSTAWPCCSLVLGAFVALRQRDVKRMLAYSSINHAGFILLGVVAGTARGVSASLYYLFAYMLMTIGSFAVVTVLGRQGDADHDLSRYRGLAGRQPVLALAFAVLLLAQAGAPFTTGLWAKVQVVFAAVDAGYVPLGVIAMVTAVVAAYFYLRVAVLMYAGGGLGEPEGGTGGSAALGAGGRHGRRRADRGGDGRVGDDAGRRAGLGHAGVGGGRGDRRSTSRSSSPTRSPRARTSARGGAGSGAEHPGHRRLHGRHRALRRLAQPLIDFANQATLLFLPK